MLIFFLAVGAAVVGYFYIAGQLPSPEELQTRQTIFVSSKIFDQEGRLLNEVMDPQGGRRTYVSLNEISPFLVEATIATEDRNYYDHPGFDPIAVMRAVYYNLSERRIVSGASTITQQVAKNVLLDPEERLQETAWRKIKEAVLAAELTRIYPKDTILEIYLNENNYGNLAYGIQAAAETYFDVDAADLTLAQASFLAGLPQAPAMYDPFSTTGMSPLYLSVIINDFSFSGSKSCFVNSRYARSISSSCSRLPASITKSLYPSSYSAVNAV